MRYGPSCSRGARTISSDEGAPPLGAGTVPSGGGGSAGVAVASVGPVRVLASEELDAGAVADRLERRRAELRDEIERAERKLGNEGFVAKAPTEVVEEERGKLERYKVELAELA